jgi:hypothetical protein
LSFVDISRTHRFLEIRVLRLFLSFPRYTTIFSLGITASLSLVKIVRNSKIIQATTDLTQYS